MTELADQMAPQVVEVTISLEAPAHGYWKATGISGPMVLVRHGLTFGSARSHLHDALRVRGGGALVCLREKVQLPSGATAALEAALTEHLGTPAFGLRVQETLRAFRVHVTIDGALEIVRFIWPELANDPDRRLI